MADPNIRSYYDDKGFSHTEVDGSFPVIQPLTARDQLMALIDQESRALPRLPMSFAPRPRVRGGSVGLGKNTSRQNPAMRIDGGERMAQDPLAALKAQDQYEAKLRASAMRPVGLGAQMIPGMAEDPRLLPSRLRASGSNFQNLAGPSMAGISEAPPRQAQAGGNAGFEYLTPLEQARWLEAMRRG